jgi:hypothetical protein
LIVRRHYASHIYYHLRNRVRSKEEVAVGMAEGNMMMDLKVNMLIWHLLLNIFVFTKCVLFWT